MPRAWCHLQTWQSSMSPQSLIKMLNTMDPCDIQLTGEVGPYLLGVITLCIAWITQAGSFGWPVNGQQRWYCFGNFISVAYGFTVTPPYCLLSACSGSISFPLVLCLPSQLDGCRLLFYISVLQLQQLWPGNWSDKQAFWDGKLIYFLNGCLL